MTVGPPGHPLSMNGNVGEDSEDDDDYSRYEELSEGENDEDYDFDEHLPDLEEEFNPFTDVDLDIVQRFIIIHNFSCLPSLITKLLD